MSLILLNQKKSKKFLNQKIGHILLNKTFTSKLEPIDGNTAAAYVAYNMSDTIFLYPITPASPMGELSDQWSFQQKKNIFGQVPSVTQMQSEGGAAGATHGALVTGSIPTTFTAAQGLLLMIPNMFRIAGEMYPSVFHVAARIVGKSTLSIFCDHSDVMACRQTGFAFMSSGSVQECMDLGLVSHLSTIRTSIPFLHFFDGFRISHEINSIEKIKPEDMKKLIDWEAIYKHRKRALNPEHPKVIGTVQQSDTLFQIIEQSNKAYTDCAETVQHYMDEVAKITGRQYHLFDYYGHPEAENVIILMGSGIAAAEQLVRKKQENGEKIGLIKVRLYRPFSREHLLRALPKTTKRIAVLDRTKESGSIGEPLYLDVVAALKNKKVEIYGGRYGIGSKEFTPGMVQSVFNNLNKLDPKDNFTVGIIDDVTHTNLDFEPNVDTIPKGTQQCIFWGMGSDGTVGANKNAIKIIVENTDLHGQGYFFYSAHKSGGISVSHLRFGPEPISATFEITHSDYLACHQPTYLMKYDILQPAKPGSIFVYNTPFDSFEKIEKVLSNKVKKQIASKNIKFYVIDASKIAREVGLRGRINMIMQAVFFKLSSVLPEKEAIELLKKAIEKEYKLKGKNVIEKNWEAVDKTLSNLVEVKYPKEWKNLVVEKEEEKTGELNGELNKSFTKCNLDFDFEQTSPESTGFIDKILRPLQNLEGNKLPVSVFPESGIIPHSISKYEKRGIAELIPKWNPTNCIQCNMCALLCPHSAVRPFALTREEKADIERLNNNTALETIPLKGAKTAEPLEFRIQISPYDCTGCEVCVNACPEKCFKLVDFADVVKQQNTAWEYVSKLPIRSTLFKPDSLKGSQFMQPLLEFADSCAGCGEPATIKLVTQLFGDQMIIANATGCTCVWGGSFPISPFTVNKDGHGPAWGQSLFEDNAEYGLGMAKATKQRRLKLKDTISQAIDSNKYSEKLTAAFKKWIEFFDELKKSKEISDEIKEIISNMKERDSVLDEIWRSRDILSQKTQWIIGGDGWAYDIGFGGVDHVLSSGEDVNILVLDTEVYSNTGGQSSKATPRGGIAKFTSSGKPSPKKDLASIAMTYGNVYVASICLAANPNQALKAIKEAQKFKGTSLIIAYAPCIAHGIKKGMGGSVEQSKSAVESGYWNLFRYNPDNKFINKPLFVLDSPPPRSDLFSHIYNETRFSSLSQLYPLEAQSKHDLLKEDVRLKYAKYKMLEDFSKIEAKKDKENSNKKKKK
ncbi:pyruvate-flavodoxin oxidoreductase-related [Anaeramoeba ignava]|uniref:Pyruvate-flavodoxin oxidoreductase-related n=1 Tax=Anaeramoeba ignava TaxID=1746090 RepID=A0A9Q0RG67_ANAIG|nr:pyruvate-flavodoxin oxidoreductase-related [Anaeramoeba ignava]